LRASSCFCFAEGFFEDIHYSPVAGTIRSLLTGDDISQPGNDNPFFVKGHLGRAGAEAVEGTYAVDSGHEINLQAVIVADQAEKPRDRVVRLKDHCVQCLRDRVKFSKVCGCIANQEIEIDGGNRSTLERGGGVANQNRFEVLLTESAGNGGNYRFRVQLPIIATKQDWTYCTPRVSVAGYLHNRDAIPMPTASSAATYIGISRTFASLFGVRDERPQDFEEALTLS